MPSGQIETWKAAAADLQFKLVAPFSLETDRSSIEYFGHLPQFGSPRGMLVIVGSYTPAHLEAARDRGFGYTCLSEDTSPYDRVSFIEMLSDWGWTGRKEEAPSWLR